MCTTFCPRVPISRRSSIISSSPMAEVEWARDLGLALEREPDLRRDAFLKLLDDLLEPLWWLELSSPVETSD